MEIKFPGYGGTKQLGYKSEISGSYSQLSKQMKKQKYEGKKIKAALAVNIKLFEADKFDTLLKKFNFWKFLRITSWVSRFINNARRTKVKKTIDYIRTHQSTKVLDQKRATRS